MVVPLKSVPDSPLSLFIPVANKQKLYMTNDFKQEWDIKLYMNNNSYKKKSFKNLFFRIHNTNIYHNLR